MKKYIIIIWYIIFISGCYPSRKNDIISINQDKSGLDNLEFIDNRTIKYSITLRKCDTCYITPSHNFHLKTNLTDNELTYLKKIKYEDWLRMLNDEKKDWATNLILYDFYNRSPELFIVLQDFKRPIFRWRKNDKILDIEFWKKNIPHAR